MTKPLPQVESLPVAKLTIDPDLQRALDKTRVDKIAKDYQPEAVGTIIVSHRDDGTYHVIDGQHRVSATIAAGYGDRTLPCLVHNGLTRAEEAALFRRHNNTRQVSPIDRFRVRVIEEDPAAVVLNTILTAHGWRVTQSKNAGAFAAVTAFEGIYRGKINGPGTTRDICNTTISVITEAWGHDANGVRAEVVGGIGAVLLRYNTRIDLPKLVMELSTHANGPLGLIRKARGLRDYRGGRLPDALAEVIVELLNKSKRTNRLPDWRSA